MKKRIGKRRKLIALLSTVAVLAAGGIGTGVAFSAMAAVSNSSSVTSSSPSAFKEIFFKAEGQNGEKVKEVK